MTEIVDTTRPKHRRFQIGRLSRLSRRVSPAEWLLFVTIFACSAFFSEISYQTGNYTARLFLTRAVVDQGTFQVDVYAQKALGGDEALYEGHLYSNKPPGSSLLMLPQYILIGKPAAFALRALGFDPTVQNERYDPVDVFTGWLVQIFSLALYTAVSFVVLYRLLDLLAIQRGRFLLALLSYFGTLMFAYSTIGTGEMYTVPLLLLGTYFLLLAYLEKGEPRKANDWYYLCAGFWYGLAFFTTNQIILMSPVALAAIAWRERQWRPLFLFSLPLLFFGLLTLLYNWAAFGDPFNFPMEYWIRGPSPTLIFEWPTPGKLAEMLFLPWKGIFFYSPYLLLAIPGFWLLYRRLEWPTRGPVILLLAGSFLVYFLYLACNAGWFGGDDFGFRYIVPALPFLAIGAAAWLSRDRPSGLEIALIVGSVVICSFGALTDPEVPNSMMIGFEVHRISAVNPLLDYNLPLFLRLATNNVPNVVLEQLFGLDVWLLRLATTVVFLSALGGFLWRYRRHWADSSVVESSIA